MSRTHRSPSGVSTPSRLSSRGALLAAVLAGATGLAACEGCRTPSAVVSALFGGAAAPSAAPAAAPSTLRLYVLSDVAGALEPCGCVKDQLGGLDHAAAWIASERGKSGASVLVSAGPLFFRDATLSEDERGQAVANAETMARALGGLGLAAFAPGRNDSCAGAAVLSTLTEESGAAAVANAVAVRDVGGVKVGFLGVSPSPVGGPAVEPAPPPPADGGVAQVRAMVAEAKAKGADVLVALVAAGRGPAKRIAEAVPELTVVVAGSAEARGDVNSTSPPAERIGPVLVVETANHLQTVGVVDLYVRGRSFTFADGSGVEDDARRQALTRRIDELRARIADWERDGTIARRDLDARRADVERLERERAALDQRPPPAEGSFLRYTFKEVRDALGRDAAVTAQMDAYYKRVNEENRKAFENRLPKPVTSPTESSYVGVQVCARCHAPAFEVWKKTRHSLAYETLSRQYKEFNLDCVRCHVTGYERSGGSTLAHVKGLEAVQCEVCHGPGSRHAQTGDKQLIVGKPQPDRCLECHIPPHVHGFDAPSKFASILGPGHGKPL